MTVNSFNIENVKLDSQVENTTKSKGFFKQ